MVRYIDPELFEEIILKKKKIEGFPIYYDLRKQLVLENIRSIGDVYSFWIENPELRRVLLMDNRQPKTLKKEARQGIQNVHNAWYMLMQQGKNNLFIKDLNLEVIRRVNGLIMGEKFSDFRERDVTLGFKDYTPPSFEKVDKKMKNALSKVKQMYQYNPLEAAITAGLEFSAIQPFDNGNKRTARLIQDRILYDSGFVPAIIPAGEGKFYRNLLGETLPSYDDGIVEGQKTYYDYFASKVNNGLDEILGDLEEEP